MKTIIVSSLKYLLRGANIKIKIKIIKKQEKKQIHLNKMTLRGKLFPN